MPMPTAGLATVLAALVVSTLPAGLRAQTVVESFEARAGWTWGLPTAVVESGGDPAAYLVTPVTLDAALPMLRTGTGVASPFVGDYRGTGVRGVGVTLRIDSVPTPQGRDLSVVLTNNGGTPGNVDDDCSAYYVGEENIPLPGAGWTSYSFRIPAQRKTLPQGWQLLSVAGNSCPGLTDDEAWNLVATDVDQLGLSYGDPSLFYIFQQWVGLALDNPILYLTE